MVDHGEMWVRSPDFLVVSDSERRRVPESAVGGEKGKAVYAMHDEHDRLGFRWPISCIEDYDSKLLGGNQVNLYTIISSVS